MVNVRKAKSGEGNKTTISRNAASEISGHVQVRSPVPQYFTNFTMICDLLNLALERKVLACLNGM